MTTQTEVNIPLHKIGYVEDVAVQCPYCGYRFTTPIDFQKMLNFVRCKTYNNPGCGKNFVVQTDSFVSVTVKSLRIEDDTDTAGVHP